MKRLLTSEDNSNRTQSQLDGTSDNPNKRLKTEELAAGSLSLIFSDSYLLEFILTLLDMRSFKQMLMVDKTTSKVAEELFAKAIYTLWNVPRGWHTGLVQFWDLEDHIIQGLGPLARKIHKIRKIQKKTQANDNSPPVILNWDIAKMVELDGLLEATEYESSEYGLIEDCTLAAFQKLEPTSEVKIEEEIARRLWRNPSANEQEEDDYRRRNYYKKRILKCAITRGYFDFVEEVLKELQDDNWDTYLSHLPISTMIEWADNMVETPLCSESDLESRILEMQDLLCEYTRACDICEENSAKYFGSPVKCCDQSHLHWICWTCAQHYDEDGGSYRENNEEHLESFGCQNWEELEDIFGNEFIGAWSYACYLSGSKKNIPAKDVHPAKDEYPAKDE